jgi:hypothetical protein
MLERKALIRGLGWILTFMGIWNENLKLAFSFIPCLIVKVEYKW